jgi:hypothetical protein
MKTKDAGLCQSFLISARTRWLFVALALLTPFPGPALAGDSGTASVILPTVTQDTMPAGREDYEVFWVENRYADTDLTKQSTQAGFGDRISLHIKDLDLWRKYLVGRKELSGDTTFEAFTKKLVLVVNGLVMEDIHADTIMSVLSPEPYHIPVPKETPNADYDKKWAAWQQAVAPYFNNPATIFTPDIPGTYTVVDFTLTRTDVNRPQWAKLLHKPSIDHWELSKRMEMSVAFKRDDGGYEACPTSVRSYDKDDKEYSVPMYQFYLVAISHGWLTTTVILAVLSLILLGLMARAPGLLRDPNQSVKADGLYPFSLSRCQMACWLYLIGMSYILIWATVGRDNAINSTATILLGITSATAVGSAVVGGGGGGGDSAKTATSVPGLTKEDIAKIHPAWWRTDLAWFRRKETADKMVKDAEEALKTATSDEDKAAKEAHLNALKQARDYLSTWSVQRFLSDILSEKDPQTGQYTPSIGRFQMMIWTVVLGLVFVIDVYNNLEMPDFDISILALMGISAGAYLGFKASPKG